MRLLFLDLGQESRRTGTSPLGTSDHPGVGNDPPKGGEETKTDQPQGRSRPNRFQKEVSSPLPRDGSFLTEGLEEVLVSDRNGWGGPCSGTS